MKRMIFITALLAMLLFAFSACAGSVGHMEKQPDTQGTKQVQQESKGRMPAGGIKVGPIIHRDGAMGSLKPDKELQAILDEVQDKYRLLTFTDPDTGFKMQYELFVPENYNRAERYPLVMFIPDARAAGRTPAFSLNVGWGGVIWATAEEQAKHPSFVLVPIFTEVIVDDDFNTSPQIETAVKLIHNLCDNYSIDTNRLYTTGQSMGGMTSFHLNVTQPDLFAASLFVGSQWNNELLQVLEKKKFFYIVSAGDSKASAGQAGLMAVFAEDGVAYTHEQWSAQEARAVQNACVQAMLAKSLNANFITFIKGTTFIGEEPRGGEHLTSFDYAYKLEAVRDWLFAQSKEK